MTSFVFALLLGLCAKNALASASCSGIGMNADSDRFMLRCRVSAVSDVYSDRETISHAEFLSRLSRISEMPGLRSLCLDVEFDSPHFVVDVGGFEGLTNLVSMSVKAPYEKMVILRNLGRLRNLPIKYLSLLHVDLENHQDLALLSGLKSFETTLFSHTRHVCSEIESLSFRDAHRRGFVYLSRFRKLRKLCFLDVWCKGVPGVEAIDGLESLVVRGQLPFYEDKIAGFRKLSKLTVCSSWSTTFDPGWIYATAPFGSLPLKSLCLQGTKLHKISDIETCPIVNLRITRSPIRSIDDICKIPTLKHLDVSETAISKVDVRAAKLRFPNLETVAYTDDYGVSRQVDIEDTSALKCEPKPSADKPCGEGSLSVLDSDG